MYLQCVCSIIQLDQQITVVKHRIQLPYLPTRDYFFGYDSESVKFYNTKPLHRTVIITYLFTYLPRFFNNFMNENLNINNV